MATFQFVDSFGSAEVVRLDLNYGPLRIGKEGLDLSPAPVRRSVSSTVLSDGDLISAAAWGNRVLRIPIQLLASSADEAASVLQRLARELARETNILRVQLGSMPYYFRTFFAPDYVWSMRKLLIGTGVAMLEIPAEPFAYGPKQSLATVTVNNDPAAATNGLYFDVTDIKGDVETPPIIRINNTSPYGAAHLTSVYAVRRRGTPSQMPLVLQAESMTVGTDTAVQTNDPLMSGAGSNYARCTFATVTNMDQRLSVTNLPASPVVDARGTYRVWLRCRQSSASAVIKVMLTIGAPGVPNNIVSGVVILPSDVDRKWVDLGLITIPIFGDPIYDGYSGVELAPVGLGLGVQAQRVSGSGSLDFDVLAFVPADDRYCSVWWSVVGAQQPDLVVLDGPMDATYPMDSAPLEVHSNNQGIARVGSLPMFSPGVTNRVVMLMNVSGPSDIEDDKTFTATVNVDYWPRYLHIRTAST